jgi:hypothetical protein
VDVEAFMHVVLATPVRPRPVSAKAAVDAVDAAATPAEAEADGEKDLDGEAEAETETEQEPD